MPSSTPSGNAQADDMRRSYVRVVIAWAAVLLALYAFQEYFAVR
jgi:hypothetical protein